MHYIAIIATSSVALSVNSNDIRALFRLPNT